MALHKPCNDDISAYFFDFFLLFIYFNYLLRSTKNPPSSGALVVLTNKRGGLTYFEINDYVINPT